MMWRVTTRLAEDNRFSLSADRPSLFEALKLARFVRALHSRVSIYKVL